MVCRELFLVLESGNKSQIHIVCFPCRKGGIDNKWSKTECICSLCQGQAVALAAVAQRTVYKAGAATKVDPHDWPANWLLLLQALHSLLWNLEVIGGTAIAEDNAEEARVSELGEKVLCWKALQKRLGNVANIICTLNMLFSPWRISARDVRTFFSHICVSPDHNTLLPDS